MNIPQNWKVTIFFLMTSTCLYWLGHNGNYMEGRKRKKITENKTKRTLEKEMN